MTPKVTVYNVVCKCGFRHEGIEGQTRAECIADAHESASIRRQYRHSTNVEVARS